MNGSTDNEQHYSQQKLDGGGVSLNAYIAAMQQNGGGATGAMISAPLNAHHLHQAVPNGAGAGPPMMAAQMSMTFPTANTRQMHHQTAAAAQPHQTFQFQSPQTVVAPQQQPQIIYTQSNAHPLQQQNPYKDFSENVSMNSNEAHAFAQFKTDVTTIPQQFSHQPSPQFSVPSPNSFTSHQSPQQYQPSAHYQSAEPLQQHALQQQTVQPAFSSNVFEPTLYPMNMSVHQQRYSSSGGSLSSKNEPTVVFGPNLIPKNPLEANEHYSSFDNISRDISSTSLKHMLPVSPSMTEAINTAENVIIASNKKQIRALQTQVMHLMKELNLSNNMMAKMKMELKGINHSFHKHGGKSEFQKYQDTIRKLQLSEAAWREKAESLGAERELMLKSRHNVEKRLLQSRIEIEDIISENKKLREALQKQTSQQENESTNEVEQSIPGSSSTKESNPPFVFKPHNTMRPPSSTPIHLQPPVLRMPIRNAKKVFCLYAGDQNYYPALVTQQNEDGTVNVIFSDYGEDEYIVPQTYIREHIIPQVVLTDEERMEILKAKRETDLAKDRARIDEMKEKRGEHSQDIVFV